MHNHYQKWLIVKAIYYIKNYETKCIHLILLAANVTMTLSTQISINK